MKSLEPGTPGPLLCRNLNSILFRKEYKHFIGCLCSETSLSHLHHAPDSCTSDYLMDVSDIHQIITRSINQIVNAAEVAVFWSAKI